VLLAVLNSIVSLIAVGFAYWTFRQAKHDRAILMQRFKDLTGIAKLRVWVAAFREEEILTIRAAALLRLHESSGEGADPGDGAEPGGKTAAGDDQIN
jgi:hypothetical protein